MAQRAVVQRRDRQLEDHDELVASLDSYRSELTGYCYRMLGSPFEAEDAVQETLLRAWRSIDGFEGRSSLRSWLYTIATNVCLRMLEGRQRRSLPMDLTNPSPGTGPVGPPLPESVWIQPIPDNRIVAALTDPAERAVARESIRLAFVAALHHLPPRQRAVLILRDVLGWRASEVAALLETTVVSVNSALQRARTSLAALDPGEAVPEIADDERRRLLDRYIDAFERFDIEALVQLLHEDATLSMPPQDFWLRGVAAIHDWWLVGQGSRCPGAVFLPVRANGTDAFGIYHRDPDGGDSQAFGIQVVELAGDRIAAMHTFIRPELFPLFGLPPSLPR